MGTIVVGVDGSDGASAALEFAIEEAGLRKAGLRLVCAWELPVGVYGAGFGTFDPGAVDSFRERAEEIVNAAAEIVAAREPMLACESIVEERQPAAALLEHAKDAMLVVVGNRGLGGFKSLMLGSVSQQVVHHAPCPVVVVREPHA